MPINKYNSYSLFIGPCIDSGFNFINYSGRFTNGGIKAIQNSYTIDSSATLTASLFNNNGVGSVQEVNFNGESVLMVEATSSNPAVPCGVDRIGNYPASGYVRLYGEIYIPSTNLNTTRASISLNETVLIATGYDQWIPVSAYFKNVATSNNTFMLAQRDGNTVYDSFPSPSFSVQDGDRAYFRNIQILLESGQVPFSGDVHINLLQQVDLVQSVSIDLNHNITSIKELGNPRYIARDNLFYPEGTLSFSYLQHSLENELKCGFNMNFADPFYKNGSARYDGYDYDILQNLTGTRLTGFASGFLYPLANNRYKNFYLNVFTNSTDSNLINPGTGHADFYKDNYTLAIGNAYLKSYRVAGNVQSLPIATISYGFYNITDQARDFGKNPFINPESGNYQTGQYYWIPKVHAKNYPITIPSKIQISISGINALYNLTGALWQDYDFGFDFDIKQNERFGYCIPGSYNLNLPATLDIGLRGLVNEEQRFYLTDIHSRNELVNIGISYNACTGNGIAEMIKYDFRGAKINNLQTEYSVNNLHYVNISLTQELSKPKNGNGVFMSGNLWRNPRYTPKNIAIKNKDDAIDFIIMSGDNIWLYGN